MEYHESLFPPNTPETYIYAGIFTALDRVRSADTKQNEVDEYILQADEFHVALNVLDKYRYPLPQEITLTWMSEPARETSPGFSHEIESGFIHLSYPDTTMLYVFTKEVNGELHVRKEMMSERSRERAVGDVADRQMPWLASPLEIDNEEMEMLAEMMGAVLFINKPR